MFQMLLKGLFRKRGIAMYNNNRIHRSYIIAMCLATLIFFSFLQPLNSENLVSNVDGKITVIILHYGEGRYGGFWFDQIYFFRELMDTMDKDVAFVILMGKDDKADSAKETLKPYTEEKLPDGTSRLKFLTVDVKTSRFYPWARDPYMILFDEHNNLIFLDAGWNTKPFPITNFDEVFSNAKSLAGTIHRGGGNIRTTNHEMIIGIDTMLSIEILSRWYTYVEDETLFSLAKKLKPEDLSVYKARFEAYSNLVHKILAPNKKMVTPGKKNFFSTLEKGEFPYEKRRWITGAQASYHTDVYLGLGHIDATGTRVIFVADSKLGAQIVEKMTPEERRLVEKKMPAVLLEEGFNAAGVPINERQIAERFQWHNHKLLDLCVKKAHKLADKLDKTAQHLEDLGYRVVRIPYLPNGLDNDSYIDGAMGISFNYSNVLNEVYNDIKRVYMPQFGFKQLDEAAKKAYQEAGFQTIIIKGFVTNALTSSNANAGLDCLTSEIRFPVRWAKKYYDKK